jgi:hypothetical protein
MITRKELLGYSTFPLLLVLNVDVEMGYVRLRYRMQII